MTGVEVSEITSAFRISGPWPHPIVRGGRFECEASRAQRVRADLLDVSGRRIGALFDTWLAAGERKVVTFDAERLPAGVYFLRVEGANEALTQRIVVVR